MPLVAPDEGEILLLQYIVNMTAATDPVLHLYNNTDLTVDEAVTIGDITEASATGYAAITLTGGSWTTTQSVGVTTAEYSEQTFAFTTGASLYGYYVTDTSNNLLWLEEFSGAPFTLPSGGGTIAITSNITLD